MQSENRAACLWCVHGTWGGTERLNGAIDQEQNDAEEEESGGYKEPDYPYKMVPEKH